MPDKLTDKKIPDIKELLEYKAKVGCQNCDLIGKGCCSTCVNSLIKSFIGLFDRLQEENENLRDSLVKKRFKDEMFEMTLKEYTDGKIKEFAERLKENFEPLNSPLLNNRIDKLLKELEGK